MFKNLRWKAAQFFEIRWWKLYLGNKDKAAYLDWKTKYWRDFLEKSDLSVPPHVRVLDAGCGPAEFLRYLRSKPPMRWIRY